MCMKPFKIFLMEFMVAGCATAIAGLTFYFYSVPNEPENMIGLLTNILTVNGVFSAILITYLFTRLAWTKERQSELHNEAIGYSQKITEFRRILKVLTNYYGVWPNKDVNSKSLLEHGKYETLEYYDFWTTVNSRPGELRNKLADEFWHDKNYDEFVSVLYLAMVSFVGNRTGEYKWQEELFKDFEKNFVYDHGSVKRWLFSGTADIIGTRMNHDYEIINYSSFKEEEQMEIIAAAARINPKYANYKLNNKLIESLAQDMQNHYVLELYRNLEKLKVGLDRLSLLTLSLILASLLFGVLLPFMLLMISEVEWFPLFTKLISTINIGLVSYTMLKLPIAIVKEFKWSSHE